MWPSQIKSQKLCRYRGMSKMILENMYTEWLRNHCEDSLDHIRLNVNEKNADNLLEKVVKNNGIAFVIYGEGENHPRDELNHVALLISRVKHGVEYVDCMANPFNQSQINFEEKCIKMCGRYGKPFVGSKKLFSYSESEEKYEFFPPQTAEQQFVGLYLEHPKHFFEEIEEFMEEYEKELIDQGMQKEAALDKAATEKQRMKKFAERYSYHGGGDCIFWAFHLATQLSKMGISAHKWFKRQTWFEEQDIMKAGAEILQYVTNQIFASLLRCQKSKLKRADDIKSLQAKNAKLAIIVEQQQKTIVNLEDSIREVEKKLVAAKNEISDLKQPPGLQPNQHDPSIQQKADIL